MEGGQTYGQVIIVGFINNNKIAFRSINICLGTVICIAIVIAIYVIICMLKLYT